MAVGQRNYEGSMCVCVCACKCMRETGRERELSRFNFSSWSSRFSCPCFLYPFNECPFPLELIYDQPELNYFISNLLFLSVWFCDIFMYLQLKSFPKICHIAIFFSLNSTKMWLSSFEPHPQIIFPSGSRSFIFNYNFDCCSCSNWSGCSLGNMQKSLGQLFCQPHLLLPLSLLISLFILCLQGEYIVFLSYS